MIKGYFPQARFLAILFLLVLALMAMAAPGLSQEETPGSSSPLNPRFVEYLNNLAAGRLQQTSSKYGYALGAVPVTDSLDHLVGQRIFGKQSRLGLPVSYDLRTLNKLTSIRNQGSCGSCWAFGAMGSLESSLRPGENPDYSEGNVKNTAGFDWGCCDGGNGRISMAYFTRWSGPVNESDDPYNYDVTNCTSPSGRTTRKHVQDIITIPDKANPLDNDNIKNAVMTYGAVHVVMSYDDPYFNAGNASFYNNGPVTGNHIVCVVGWDDNYSASKFNTAPPGNGAYICRNSWGTGFGQSGYFYASYYDNTIGYDGGNAVFTAEPATNYSRIYQYDWLGWVARYGFSSNTGWAANIFTVAGAESVQAVGFYNPSVNSPYEIRVYKDPNSGPLNTAGPAAVKTGTMATPGFHTIRLDSAIPLTAGQRFSVVVKLTAAGTNYPIVYEYPQSGYASAARANPGESWVSSNGSSWSDMTSKVANANVCVKAYTIIGTGTISGKVTSVADGSAIAGAAVSLNVGLTTTTDASGNYTFANLAPDSYIVTATKASFNPRSVAAAVTSYNTTTCNLALSTTVMSSVFTEKFANVNGWTAHPTFTKLSIDTTKNHSGGDGTYSAKATASTTQGYFMYHPFSPAFATGKLEGWFYDDNSAQSEHVLQIRDYASGDGSGVLPTYAVFLGTETGNSATQYSTGIYQSSWTKAMVGTRSAGWHKFTLEFLPYTGVGDLNFYVDDNLVSTQARPSNSDVNGINRIYLSYNFATFANGWFDDITFSAPVPNSPTMNEPAVGTTSIVWSWTPDLTKDSRSFRLTDSSGAVLADVPRGGSPIAFTENNLTPNFGYTRKLVAVNGTVLSPEQSITRVTLAPAPTTQNVTCDRSVRTLYNTASFNFTAVGGFGTGKAQYYRWVFDRNASHTWDNTEPIWNGGTLSCSANAPANSWYLHVQAYNSADTPSGTMDFGPFFYKTQLIFTDNFTNLNNWTVHPNYARLTLDTSKNHTPGDGSFVAQAPLSATTSYFMYRPLTPAFATGRCEVWFYDDNSPSGEHALHFRDYSNGDTQLPTYVSYFGVNTGRSVSQYTLGFYQPNAWNYASVGTRSQGWHKWTIEFLPFTGSGDMNYYLDDNLVATRNRPANSGVYGISRVYIGFNYASYSNGWFDDMAFYSDAPDAPTIGPASVVSNTAIDWTWADNSNNEFGFRLLDQNDTAVAEAPGNTTSYQEENLSPNTSYTRKLVSFNGSLNSAATGTVAKRTLSEPPTVDNVTCDKAVSEPSRTAAFTFTAVGGFGTGTVQYYRQVFDQNPTHTWTGSEPQWSLGNLVGTATNAGETWYLHVKGYNADGIENGALDLGPYLYDGVAPGLTDVSITEITRDSAVVSWSTDEPATASVDYGLTTAYGTSTPLDSNLAFSHSVTLTGLAAGSDYHLRVRSADAAGNEVVSGDNSFRTASTQFTSAPNLIQVGWNLISLPATPVSPDPQVVLSGIDVPNVSLQYWKNDAPGGGYQLYGETFGWTGPMTLGIPYWFLEGGSEKGISFWGNELTGDWQGTIAGHPGAPYWVALGHPFNHATLCANIKFASAPSQPTALGWEAAYGAGLVESSAQGYSSLSHSFFSAGPAAFMIERDRFEPWSGYWLLIRTTEPLTITIPIAPVAP